GAGLHDSYIYRLPFVPFFFYNVSAPALGVARGAVEEYARELAARPNSANVGRQLRLSESAAEVDAALALMRADMAEVVETGRAEREMTRDQLVRWERN